MPIQAHQHPALTVDIVLFALERGEVSVLLIQRGKPPYQGMWAFPGGFVNIGESLKESAFRELEEETGVRDVQLRQLRAFGDPNRDPRGHVVTVAYVAIAGSNELPPTEASSDAGRARWWAIGNLPPLAFDHSTILTYALQRLLTRLVCSSVDSVDRHAAPEDLSPADLRDVCRVVAESLEKDI